MRETRRDTGRGRLKTNMESKHSWRMKLLPGQRWSVGCKHGYHGNDAEPGGTHQSSLASAVRPAMEMPIWLSTWRIFFWCAASSDWALCTSTQTLRPLFFLNRHLLGQQTSDRTFNATRTAWVLDLSPTVAEPCFTASMAYSI